jgi:hypothetical protein
MKVSLENRRRPRSRTSKTTDDEDEDEDDFHAAWCAAAHGGFPQKR